ncbi:hypothetical protein WJX77_007351 [Trebouxia sp. C0004]
MRLLLQLPGSTWKHTVSGYFGHNWGKPAYNGHLAGLVTVSFAGLAHLQSGLKHMSTPLEKLEQQYAAESLQE